MIMPKTTPATNSLSVPQPGMPVRTDSRVVSIMQPYFFPYIGYFQLIKQADVFVFFDDVQYIQRGWINRNRILLEGALHWITLPICNGGRHLAINERHYKLDPVSSRKILPRIEAAYRKSPRFSEIFAVVKHIMNSGIRNVAEFNANLIQVVAADLGIRTRFALSAEIVNDKHLRGQARILEICRCLGATHYVNPSGGMPLYQAERFADQGMQ